jgi:TonB family protein
MRHRPASDEESRSRAPSNTIFTICATASSGVNVSSWLLCAASALLHVGLAWLAQAALGGPVQTEAPGAIEVELKQITSLDQQSWAEGIGASPAPRAAATVPAPLPDPERDPERRPERASAWSSRAPARDRETETSPAVATRAVAIAPELARFALRSSDVPRSSAHGIDVWQPVAPESPPVPEDRVSVRARLLSAGVVVYPPRARAAEIEADVRLEIVVDRRGRVSHARPLSRPGHGLEAAALAALRGYRFSPALLGEQPVPVRMLWTVQFRLR